MSDLSRKSNTLNLKDEPTATQQNSNKSSSGSDSNTNQDQFSSDLQSFPMKGNELEASMNTVRGSNLTTNLNLRYSGGLLYDNMNASVNTLTNSNGTNTPLVDEKSDDAVTPVEGTFFNNRGSSHSSLPIASAPRDIPSLRKSDLIKDSNEEAVVDDDDDEEEDVEGRGESKEAGDVANITNDDGVHASNISIDSDTDNHGQESPELLATSVGMDEDGRLVPSTSNISLLSLNYSQMTANLASMPLNSNQTGTSFNNGLSNNPNYVSSSVNQNSATQVIYSGPWVNKAQLSSINQQRYNYYSGPGQNLSQSNLNSQISNTSIPPASGLYRKYSMNQQQQQQQSGLLVSPQPPSTSTFSHSSTISPKPILARADSMTLRAPDSPPLNPTSVGGSPSGFWLGNGSPPNSIPNGTYLSNSYLTSTQESSINNNGINTTVGTSRTNSFGVLPNWRVPNQLQQLQNKIQKPQLHPQHQTQTQSHSQSHSLKSSPQQLQHQLRGQPIPTPTMTRQKSISDETPYASIGNRSPDFAPVGTLPPMTPLNLSSGSMMNALGSGNDKSPSLDKSNMDDDHGHGHPDDDFSSSRSGYQLDEEDDDNTDVFAQQHDADDL